MAINLLEMFTDAVGDQLVSQASKFLGESESGTKSALDLLVPALLGGVAKQGSSLTGAADLLKTLAGSEVSTDLLGNLAGLFSGGGKTDTLVTLGTSLVRGLLGDKAGSLVDTVASITGLKSSSSSNLLYMAAPLLFGLVKKLVGDRGLDAAGLMKLLAEQVGLLKGKVDNRVTGALGLGSLFDEGVKGVAQTARTAAGAYSAKPEPEPEKSLLGKLLPWLLIGAGVLAALAALRNCQPQAPTEQAVVAPAPAPKVVAPTPAPAPAAAALPAKVYFAVGSPALDAQGKSTLATVATQVKQLGYKVDITGYTDKTGDVALNEELAKQRAVAVRDTLIAGGVAPGQITMKPPTQWTGTTTGSGNDAEARRVDVTRSP